ncbi:MAG: hypothetical protein C0463_03230 [Idiomarina sp.]|nr:hypothetical protein [Idiomarina sp.]
MAHSAHVELAKLHDEFPILNDIEATLAFSMNEGDATPRAVAWNLAPNLCQHLARLGITERLRHLVVQLARYQDGCCCGGRIEFNHGHCRVCW